MREYLVSWYGITDFKASLGIENSGPLLGAVTSTNYTDIQILGYTKSEDAVEQEFEDELKNLDVTDKVSANDFVYRWANTTPAHKYFIRWLESKIPENPANPINVSLGFTPVKLKRLNDTEGIYAAAVHLLETIADGCAAEETFVTLFLSPGTPVMAYCWAMAALKYPQFKKRLIASPDPRKGPEVICLPMEWMEWYGKQKPLETRNGKYFDVFFHLYGEQRIPSYLGLKQFNCKNHVFVKSGNYHAVDVMTRLTDDKYNLSEFDVDAYDPKNVQEKLLKYIEDNFGDRNVKIGFNLTGGTKLMYAGAINVCRQLGGIPVYFNTRDKKVVFLNDFSSKPIVRIEKVEDFIKLNSNGLNITDVGRNDTAMEDMVSLTNLLWKKRDAVLEIATELKKNHFSDTYSIKRNGLKVYYENSLPHIETDDRIYVFEDISQFKVYITGGWFEEYIYNGLQPLVKSRKITDLRHSVKISYESSNGDTLEQLLGLTKTDNNKSYQELDVTFTDGYRLYVIECKSGRAEVEHVMKLENIVRYYGGIEGKGILLYSNTVDSLIVQKKAEESKNVKLFDNENLIEKIERLIASNE